MSSRLIRERGISGVGVDALTEAVGMTHGSLYSQFGSKGRLVEEALAHAFVASGKTTVGAATLAQYIAACLAPEHRDRPGHGCPLAAFACERPRQSDGVRARFTDGVCGMLKHLKGRLKPELKPAQRDEQALATVASLVGAIVLARAVDDPELSDAILRATRKQLKE